MLDADKPNSSQLSYSKQQKPSAAKLHRIRKPSASMNIQVNASNISIQWKLLPQQQDISL